MLWGFFLLLTEENCEILMVFAVIFNFKRFMPYILEKTPSTHYRKRARKCRKANNLCLLILHNNNNLLKLALDERQVMSLFHRHCSAITKANMGFMCNWSLLYDWLQ